MGRINAIEKLHLDLEKADQILESSATDDAHVAAISAILDFLDQTPHREKPYSVFTSMLEKILDSKKAPRANPAQKDYLETIAVRTISQLNYHCGLTISDAAKVVSKAVHGRLTNKQLTSRRDEIKNCRRSNLSRNLYAEPFPDFQKFGAVGNLTSEQIYEILIDNLKNEWGIT